MANNYFTHIHRLQYSSYLSVEYNENTAIRLAVLKF